MHTPALQELTTRWARAGEHEVSINWRANKWHKHGLCGNKNTLHSIYVRGVFTSLLPCLSPPAQRDPALAARVLDSGQSGSRLFSQLALILLGVLLEFPKRHRWNAYRGIHSFSGLNPERTSLESQRKKVRRRQEKGKGSGERQRGGKERGKMGRTVRKDSRDCTQEGTERATYLKLYFLGGGGGNSHTWKIYTMTGMMVNFMCQLDWATKMPRHSSNSSVSMRVNEINI